VLVVATVFCQCLLIATVLFPECTELLGTDDNEYAEQQQESMQVAPPNTANNQVSSAVFCL